MHGEVGWAPENCDLMSVVEVVAEDARFIEVPAEDRQAMGVRFEIVLRHPTLGPNSSTGRCGGASLKDWS